MTFSMLLDPIRPSDTIREVINSIGNLPATWNDMRFDEGGLPIGDGDRLERPSWILIQSMDLIWSMEDEPIGKPTIDSTGKQDDQCNGDNCGKCEDAILDPAEAGT